MRMISKLLAATILAASTTAASASDDSHYVVVGHFSQDTGAIPRLTRMSPRIFDDMMQNGLQFGDQVMFMGTQAAPDDWFVDFTLSARAGQARPEHLSEFLDQRLADFASADAPADGSELWWTLDQMTNHTDCTSRETHIYVITNGFSAAEETADGQIYGAGVFPGSLQGCHVTMVGLAAYAPAGTSLNQRRSLEHMFELAITRGGAASYGVLN
jgi:hypothetical protein